MKRLLFWIIDCWRLVMDNRFNPLRHIPDPSIQAYFTLVLFTMWSVFFGFVGTYYLGWYGYDTVTSIIVHMGVIIPLIFTNKIVIEINTENEQDLETIKEFIELLKNNESSSK